MIRGHIHYGIHAYLMWAHCLYFTIVRDPVERIWSLWNYAKRHRTHHLYEELNRLETLGAAVRSGVSVEFNNGMCRQLCGLDGPLPQTPYADTRFPYDTDCKEVLDIVLDHLEHRRIAAGVTSNFDGFLAMMAEVFDWKNIDYQPTNAGRVRRPGDLSEADFVAIHEYNAEDLLLWQYVLEAQK